MEPGSELDAAVAERVMGWKRGVNKWWVSDTGACTRPIPSWSPSTDWRAAGEVLEKMWERGWMCRLETIYRHGEKHACWRASFWAYQTGRPEHVAESKRPEHAIALAALAAVEEKTDAS